MLVVRRGFLTVVEMLLLRRRASLAWILLSTLSLVPSSFSSKKGCWPYGEEIYLESGSSVEIFCTVDPTRANFNTNNAFSTIFYRNDARMGVQHVKVLNATTSRLSLTNITSSDRYTCKLLDMAEDKDIAADKPIFYEEPMCSTFVQVGRKPAPIRDFSCLSQNWEVLNCTWSPPLKPDLDTTYRVQYVLPSRGGKNRTYDCPNDDDLRQNRCIWTLDSDPPYKRPYRYFTFVISGHNSWGDISQKLAFNHYSRLVPSPPQDLVAANVTSTSVYIKWCIGVFCVLDDGVDYKIEYAANPSRTWTTNFYSGNEISMHRDEVAFNITHLDPDTSYTIKVSMKVRTAEEPLWSLPAIIETKTSSK